MNLRSTLKLPKEHGAWAMLYVPFVLGVAVAGTVSLPVCLLLVASTAMFIARESLLVWWRARQRARQTVHSDHAARLLKIYLVMAVMAGAPLMVIYKLYGLLPLALLGVTLLAVNGRQATELEDRTIQGEVTAIVGLTMTAAAAYYVASGRWHETAWWLWLISAAYFASSVFYVKLRVASLHRKNTIDSRRTRWRCAFYHSLLLVSLLILAVTHNLHWFVVIAFAPVMMRTLHGLVRPVQRLNLKRIGIAEIGYSMVFLILTTAGFRFGV